MSTTNPRPAFDLAAAVAADGVQPYTAAINDLVIAARAAGVRRSLVSILADRSQPEVARMRALGRVLAELDRTSPAETHLVAA